MTALATMDLEQPRPPHGFYLSPEEQERIWDQVVIPMDPDGCWRWIGRADPLCGEPIIFLRNRERRPAHIIWADTGNEPVPPRKRLVRTCENVWCVNPAHRTRQGAAARETYTADITLPGKPRAKVISADIASLPVPPELTAQTEQPEPVPEVEDARDPGADAAADPSPSPRASGAIPVDALTALFDRPGMHVFVIDNTSSQKSVYHAPDPECTGYGADWRGALKSAHAKYEEKRAKRRAGCA